MQPRISIIVPTYNCDRYLPAAIDSVRRQTYTLYELIVVDDGSTDQTQQILQHYGRQLGDRFRSVYQPNQGVAIARNQGIQLARGEFIAFLDADDTFLPDKLAAQVAVFEAHPHLGMVHSGWQRVTAQGEVLMQVEPWHQIPQLDLETWLRWKPVLPSAMMFQRDWLVRSGGFDPRFPPAEDTELVLRLSLMGCQAAWLQQITVNYRQHEDSAMHHGLPQARSLSAVIDHFFTLPNLPESIQLLERQVRYSTLTWIAWYLYHTGHYPEMRQSLQQAWRYSSYSPTETLVQWADSFTRFSQQWGVEFDADTLARSAEWRSLMGWLLASSTPNHTEHFR